MNMADVEGKYSKPVRFDLMTLDCPSLSVVLPIECHIVKRPQHPWNGDFVCWPTEPIPGSSSAVGVSGRGLEPDGAIADLKAKLAALYGKLSITPRRTLKGDEPGWKGYLEDHIKRRTDAKK